MQNLASKEKYFNSFKHHNIPVLPPGAPYLIKALSDDNIDFKEIAAIINRFPSIAVRLIALANSAWSSPVESITSIDVACSRLGLSVVRSVSIALAVSAPFDPYRCPSFNAEYFWSNALLVADTSSLLAPYIDAEYSLDVSTARTAGLLHNLGLLFLVHNSPMELDRALIKHNEDRSSSLNHVVLSELGVEPADAGQFLASKWELPRPISAAMTYYDKPDYNSGNWPLVSTVTMAIDMVSAINKGTGSDPENNLRKVSILNDLSCVNKLWPRVEKLRQTTTELAKSIFAN